MLEQTIFFVKPKSLEYAEEIFQYLRLKINEKIHSEVELIQVRKLVSMHKEGWREFYEHLSKNYMKQLNEMAEYFDGKNIDLAILEGNDIVKRVKELVGPTEYEKNLNWTIRGKWGPYKLPHTIVHSSSPGKVEREKNIIQRYNLGVRDV